MAKDLKSIRCLVVDYGLFVELAVRLARDYGKVYYHSPWQSEAPKMNTAWVGRGLENIEVVDSPFDVLDDVDLIVYPANCFASQQLQFEKLGKKIWGARKGERMELDRVWAKEEMKRRGLPVGPYAVVKGMAALRDYLKKHENVYVKVSKWRGTFETFGSKDYKSIEPLLDDVENGLGAFKHEIEFIVEGAIDDAVEMGLDAYCVDGKLPTKLMAGIEVKDLGYVGIFKPYAEIPEPLRRFPTKMESYFRAERYRCFFSADTRITKGPVPYMTDACMRAATPPNELYQEIYTNLGQIIWDGANGILTDPEPVAKYGAELMIQSSFSGKHWQPIDFPDELRRFVKLRNATRIKGRYYIIPQESELTDIGAVIGYGDTLQAAIKMCKKVADQVTGYDIHVPTATFDSAEEEIAKGEKIGLKLF
jgi:hypothetical protein